jgi:hypothetical protein
VDVLDTVKQDGPRFFEKEGPWENTVGTMALQVIDGLKVGLTDPASGGIKSVLSQQQLVELARTFLAQAAKTPGMVAGGSTELQAIVGGVAKAMAEDKNLLLAPTTGSPSPAWPPRRPPPIRSACSRSTPPPPRERSGAR